MFKLLLSITQVGHSQRSPVQVASMKTNCAQYYTISVILSSVVAPNRYKLRVVCMLQETMFYGMLVTMATSSCMKRLSVENCHRVRPCRRYMDSKQHGLLGCIQ